MSRPEPLSTSPHNRCFGNAGGTARTVDIDNSKGVERRLCFLSACQGGINGLDGRDFASGDPTGKFPRIKSVEFL
jgi:hypothetical protein